MKKLVKNGEDLKVVGIVQPSEDAERSPASNRYLLSGRAD